MVKNGLDFIFFEHHVFVVVVPTKDISKLVENQSEEAI